MTGPLHPSARRMLDVAAQRRRLAVPLTAHHLNAAGASLASSSVTAAVCDHIALEARVGGYEAAASERRRLDAVYGAAAGLLGAASDDIAQVESATVAWQRAIDALALRPGDRVLAARSSYVSSALNLLELVRTHGIEVELLPADGDGRVDLEALEAALRRPARLVTLAHMPTSSGLIEPAAAVGALARAAGVPYLLDATQTFCQVPIDVTEIGCDLLVATGRKFARGPRGTGILYVSPALRAGLRPPAPDVRGSTWTGERTFELSPTALRFETWEASHALRLGLGVALAEATALGIPTVHAHVRALATELRARLSDVPGIILTDPPAAAGGGVVTFVREGQPAVDTQADLYERGVHVTAVPAIHGQWDLGHRGLEGVVRASFHVYNDRDDLDALEDALRESARLRSASHLPPARERIGRTARAEATAAARRTEVVVIGAGIHGRSTAWQLARRGTAVIHLEARIDGHTAGSSHGRTRMIRRAYPNPIWDPFVDRAYAAWHDLESASGTTLLTTTGGVFAKPLGAPNPLSGPGCEPITGAEARAIAPALMLDDRFGVVHDPAAGILDVPGALAATRRLALDAGLELRESTPVLAWETDGDGVAVDTPAGRILADRLVICAGAWTGALVPALAPLLTPTRIVNAHFAPVDLAAVSLPELRPFAIDVPDVGLLYGFPAFDGAGVKVGLDHGPAVDPSVPQPPVRAAEETELVRLVKQFLPLAAGPIESSLACLYTMAPRNRFAIGALPGSPQVLVGAACSGHGFKFGPAVGAALADLTLGTARPDLQFLSPEAMLEPAQPAS